MNAIITEIKGKGTLLLSLKNRPIPPDAPVWKKEVDPAVDVDDAGWFPAAFPLDNLDSAGLDVTVLFPGRETGGDYTLNLLYNNDIVLFSGKAQPDSSKSQLDDKPGNTETGEQNTRCFTLAAQDRPCCFLRAKGEDSTWRLVDNNTGETLELPTLQFELYWLYEDSGDIYRRGVPVELLRDFTCHLEREDPSGTGPSGRLHQHSPEKIMASVVTWIFNRVPPRYNIIDGDPHFTRVCGRLQFSLFLDSYLSTPDDPLHWSNCYDMANIVQAFLRLIGIRDVNYVFMSPFGYLKKTQIIGRGECNNPFYSREKNEPVVAEEDPARTAFSNHAFCVTAAGKVLDACAGPHTGTETLEQYLENAIDPVHPAVPGYKPGTAADILYGKGLVMVDQTMAPVELPDFPLTKAFMEKLGISEETFKAECDQYVVYSWPDPLQCPFLSEQPRELFYTALTYGQDEAVMTWKLKQRDKGEGIKINVHIFSGNNKTSALYRFIELGSAFSSKELRYGEGEPGLGHYSAQSVVPGINLNRRYFWVYYNMIVDIVYHNSDVEVEAVNKWYRQQAETHLKESIDADLPSVDHIRCDNLAPKVGETVTVTMNDLPGIGYDFNVSGQGIRLKEEGPGKWVFRAYSEGDVTLTILAVDKSTLLMKVKMFDIKVR